MRSRPIRLLAGVLPLAAASCALLAPAPAPVASYNLELPAPAAGPRSSRSVNVLPFTAASGASGQMLLYRVSGDRFQSDYYNRLLAPPARMMTDGLRRWLSASRAGVVREPGSPLPADLLVQPRLTEFHADYRDPRRPRAVVAMVIVLIEKTGAEQRQVSERGYRREIPLGAVGPEAAVEGLSRGAAEIFSDFTSDLRRSG